MPQLEKPSGIEIEMLIHKTLTINLLKGLIRFKNPSFKSDGINETHANGVPDLQRAGDFMLV